jgi:hypothetical protein
MNKAKVIGKALVIISLMFYSSCQIYSQKNQGQDVDLRPISRIPTVLKESSGIIVKNSNRLWSHNDSGNSNDLFLFDTIGNLIRTLKISNISNIDWEDLASDDDGRIYINDAGNNENNRTDLAIHIIPNPDSFSGNIIEAASINFAFEDQTAFPPSASNRNFDIEGIIWHNDSIVMFTKNRSTPLNGYCKMYKIPALAGNHTAKLIDSVYLGSTNNDARVTAAAIHHQTGELILLTRSRLLSFQHYSGGNFFNGTLSILPFEDLPGQAEAVDFVSDNKAYITEEGASGQSGFLYEAILRKESNLNETGLLLNNFSKSIINQSIIVVFFKNLIDIKAVELIDLKGITSAISSDKPNEVSFAKLKSGIYILHVKTNLGSISEKIFINNI